MNDFKTARLDNKDILRNSISGIYYTFKEWRKLSTSDDSQNIDWMHGRTTSPTYARTRIISLEWYIDRMWAIWDEEYASVLYLEELFALQGNPWKIQERELYIQDIYDREWTLKVKIKEPLEVLEWDDQIIWSHWRWRVVLESIEDPIYRSLEQIVTAWGEWVFLWFRFPFTLPDAWDESWSILECIGTWNTDSPAKIEIKANQTLSSPIKIFNVSNDTYFIINTSLTSWDVLIINSAEEKLTKNGVNILWDREPWSIWPTVSWNTKFIVNDNDWGISPGSFDATVYFNNSLL